MKLLSDRAAATAMGEAGRQQVVTKFTTCIMMNKITDAYVRILPPANQENANSV
jgi:hypothetical protein